MSEQPRVCTRCVMDDSDPEITFDEEGVCSRCRRAEVQLAPLHAISEQQGWDNLRAMADFIRAKTGRLKYDCLVGLSGGVDSSYVAFLAHKLGLRVLAVHFDNGWNSELAVSNIHTIIDKLGYDLHTYVINWAEFKDLQRAFLKASVVDIEMVTDHAITAAMFELARRHKIKFVLSGANVATEAGMPAAWTWRKQDLRNIKAIHRRFGSRPLKSYPRMGTFRYQAVASLGLGYTLMQPLNRINYRKLAAVDLLKHELGWREYGGKHYESVFTKFYQAYILPTKFGIDKRKVHLSALVRNGEITREQAVAELSEPLYLPEELEREKRYVLKKLGFTEEEFDRLMAEPPVSHDAYPSDEVFVRPLLNLKAALRSRGLVK